MSGGWQHTQFMRHADAMQRPPVNTATAEQQHSKPIAEAETKENFSTTDASSHSAPPAAVNTLSSPSAASPAATSSLLAVMPFVPPRSPSSSSPAALPNTTSTPAALASPAASPSVASSTMPSASTTTSTSSPSPTTSPPAPTSVSLSATSIPPKVALKPVVPAAPTLSVVSYSYLPSTWNNESRPLLLCLLSNHLRTLYAPSALLGSAFRLTQLLTSTPLYRVAADGVPPKGSKSSLLLTREGMVEWKRREGEEGGVAMAEDWKGRGGGWEKVVEWMRGERQVRLVKVGEEWKEEVKEEVKEEQGRKVEVVADAVGHKQEQEKERVTEAEGRRGKRKVETDSNGRLQIKVHRRDRHSTDDRNRESDNQTRKEEERAREKETEDERERPADDSLESDERRKRKRGGRREREKRERKEGRDGTRRGADTVSEGVTAQRCISRQCVCSARGLVCRLTVRSRRLSPV